jgi:hypothetical protein
MSTPSRQSQYHKTALVKGVIVQPMMPAMKAKIKTLNQKSTMSPLVALIDMEILGPGAWFGNGEIPMAPKNG